jgi:hypothetical protein
MPNKVTCPPYLKTRLLKLYHQPDPRDGPRIKRLKEHARKVPIETIWEEIDAWSTAQITAALADIDESRS